MGWEDMKGEGALKTSSSGPRRNGRARRATVSVMEAPMKKKQVSDQDKAPLHWESQTTVATKMAAIARRKQGSEARFVCHYCSESEFLSCAKPTYTDCQGCCSLYAGLQPEGRQSIYMEKHD